jgi:transaldolase/glucose-6-phosphate isomerase
MTDERIDAEGMTIDIPDAAHRSAFETAIAGAGSARWPARLFERDTTLWTEDPKVADAINDRLGWLDAPTHFTMQIPALEGFGERVRDEGFTDAVVAGMGGSSLAPEVLDRVFGSTEDWLRLRILDSTDPAAVAAAVDDLDPLHTLFIVASKSGTTTEPLAFLADAWERVKHAIDHGDHRYRYASPGDVMIAITDPGKSQSAIPHHQDLREVFLNPPDIGGRYSALTYVGLLPASLIGLDLDPLLQSAGSMLGACMEPDIRENPGVLLGIAIGVLARAGRDKLTFVADPEIGPFGAWLEQLIAESTGKHGVGIVPVDLEPLGAVEAYGQDRVFVRLDLEASRGPVATDGTAADDRLAELRAAGHPVIRITIEDPMDLGGECMRWEVATAIAGAVLGIDPFDQPNVEEAKEQTRRLLAGHGSEEADPVAVVAADAPDLEATLARQLRSAKPNGYLAIQAFIAPTEPRTEALARIRVRLRDATHLATTVGYGPRFLHSTGQLHKGGAPIGWFLQLTSDHPADRKIPGWPYTFGRLIDAQAAGDRQVIAAKGLPILRVHLGPDPDAGLARLQAAVEAVAAATPTGGANGHG